MTKQEEDYHKKYWELFGNKEIVVMLKNHTYLTGVLIAYDHAHGTLMLQESDSDTPIEIRGDNKVTTWLKEGFNEYRKQGAKRLEPR